MKTERKHMVNWICKLRFHPQYDKASGNEKVSSELSNRRHAKAGFDLVKQTPRVHTAAAIDCVL